MRGGGLNILFVGLTLIGHRGTRLCNNIIIVEIGAIAQLSREQSERSGPHTLLLWLSYSDNLPVLSFRPSSAWHQRLIC